MNIAYTLTFDEYCEANRAHRASVGKARSPGRMLILILGMTAAGLCLVFGPVREPAISSTTAILVWVSLASPFLVLLGSVLLLGLLAARTMPEPRNMVIRAARRSGKRWLGILGWMYVLGLLIAASILCGNNPPAQSPAVAPWAAALGPRLPWIFLLVLLMSFVAFAQRGNIRKAWRSAPRFRRAHEIEIVAERIVVSSAVSRWELNWEGVVCFVESENLFLIYPDLLSFIIIPKRAFPDDAQRSAFRNMLDHLVKPTKLEPESAANRGSKADGSKNM
jgi:hypothetical protein